MFEQGLKLNSVTICSEEDREVWYSAKRHMSGYPGTHAKEITVEMENGQGAKVAWAKVTLVNGDIKMVNLSKCDEVEVSDG